MNAKKLSVLLTVAAVFAGPGLLRSQDVFELLGRGDIAAVRALIEKTPALVEAKSADGSTVLHYAAYGKDAEFVNFLVDKGAKVEARDAEKRTPLHNAAMMDRAAVAAALIRRGAALETGDDYGWTPLISCARERGGVATGRVLLDAGADINAVDKSGDSALILAAWRGKVEFVDLLLEKGAKPPADKEKAKELLAMSVSKGLARLFSRMTESGAELKAAVAGNGEILHLAAQGGSAEIVAVLLDLGLDPGRSDRLGWTPLHYAARDGRTDAARKLLERGAKLDSRTIMGQTAYNIAEERKMEAVAAFLKEKGADTSALKFPELAGDYLGEKPPGDKPELFGLGIISSVWGLHSTAVFSPDGNEVFWHPMEQFPGEVYSRGGLLMMRRVDGRWTPPALAPFSGPSQGDDQPFFSGDGKRLYFISSRALPGEGGGRKERIWFVDRSGGGWSSPQPLDSTVNAHQLHWQFSLDRKGDLYFAGTGPDSVGMQDIYLARFVDGKFEPPASVGAPVCTPGIDDTPFIAPDGSYLLFSQKFDLCVSFRNADGTWSAPINLGPEINSPSIELCPMVTADGKYLFFLSQRAGASHAYWVKADIIEKLRPAKSGPAAGGTR